MVNINLQINICLVKYERSFVPKAHFCLVKNEKYSLGSCSRTKHLTPYTPFPYISTCSVHCKKSLFGFKAHDLHYIINKGPPLGFFLDILLGPCCRDTAALDLQVMFIHVLQQFKFECLGRPRYNPEFWPVHL